jgi:hypothetical protein
MYTRDFKGLLVARMVQCRGGIINEVVFFWLGQKLNEGLDVTTWWFIDLGYNVHALFTLIVELKNFISYLYTYIIPCKQIKYSLFVMTWWVPKMVFIV